MQPRSAPRTRPTREPFVLLLLTIAAFIASGIDPVDRLTWWLEVIAVPVVGAVLVKTYRRFRLTPLTYRLLFLHGLVLMLGGHYTYAEVPLGEWARDAFDLSRNHYDRLGHFAQGFGPAIFVRELILRTSPLRPGPWLFWLTVSACLAFSAFYEMIEWWAALIGGQSAESFLGTQGDIWDTQWDMFLALVGAISAVLLLGRRHNRQLGL